MSKTEAEYGRELYSQGAVRPLVITTDLLRYSLLDEPPQEVTLTSGGERHCSCDIFAAHGRCRHLFASLVYARQHGHLDPLKEQTARLAGPRLLDAMAVAMPIAGTVRLEFSIVAEAVPRTLPKLHVGLRVGEDRLYVVRSIPRFLEAMQTGESLPFGKGFVFQPEWMTFSQEENEALGILSALCQARGDIGVIEARLLPLPDAFASALLKKLSTLPFRLSVNGNQRAVRSIREQSVLLTWQVTSSGQGLLISSPMPRGLLPLAADFSCVALENEVIAVPVGQRSLLKTMYFAQMDGIASFSYPIADAPRIISEVVPFLSLTGPVDIEEQVRRRIVQYPLKSRIYLDRDGQEVQARLEFLYGSYTVNPFSREESYLHEGRFLLRDASAEQHILDSMASYGFHVRQNYACLMDTGAIFSFLTDGVATFSKTCEVFASVAFQKMKPRKPSYSVSVHLTGSQLTLQLLDSGVPAEELGGILSALAARKSYFRLKDGTFLDFSGMEDWEEVSDALMQGVQAEGTPLSDTGDSVRMSAYRAVYLCSLLRALNVPVEEDENTRRTVNLLTGPIETPDVSPLSDVLRPYQERGFAWLKNLHLLHMGGILADDMGLGKTVQVISVILWALRNEKEKKPSIVVCPTSLTYNWQAEFERFAPEIRTLVLAGSQDRRKQLMESVARKKNVDVIITSYPLIRRDKDIVKDIPFRFAILDEAQHIKNMASAGAAAARHLQAETRFALTGTPMENHVGELWSLFDFVLPGYLLTYPQFLRQHADGKDLESLQRKIAPFLLRRLKKDVLQELPDKMETTLIARMTQEQQLVYNASLLQLKERVKGILNKQGLHRGRVQILAAITELRQICCHPSLVLEDYKAGSGKMDLLCDLLPELLESGHRVLLFSQFTSMLHLIQSSLEAMGITVMYLDGETPAAQRVNMTARFNDGEAQVFLISLKAGGTGLNLTGADTVIHYDPWWNPAAEDQATDRAHRIGQTRQVHVIRLITGHSVEEQVSEMSENKRALFDRLITAGEESVTSLTEEDIRKLFAMEERP